MAHHAAHATESIIMRNFFANIINHRLLALIRKEFNQIKRDRRLAVSLILPPILQLTLFGFALSAAVSNVRLGVVDDSHTPESRELIATMTESKAFQLSGYYFSVNQLGDAVSQSKVDAGAVIPYDYARNLARERPTVLQFLLNAMDANTATISQGYAQGVVQTFNGILQGEGLHASPAPDASANINHGGQVQLQAAFLYNPGLVDSWFIVTGVFGLLLILNSSLVASGAMVREREAGTIEQLLMSPASTTEIIVAKIVPLFVLLFMMMVVAIGVVKVVFHVPFQGGLSLIVAGGALCILSGISLGTVIATFSKSAQQAQLTSFFVNPPMSSLSGALNPVEAMPKWLQPLTVLNPIHHFATIVRASMLKGSGISSLWPNFVALIIFTLILVTLSVWRFRKQLS
jgi:ABC-2 type transport system permease protein